MTIHTDYQKIRICFLIDAVETSRAGTEKQLLELLNRLPEDKYQCYLACFKNTDWVSRQKSKWPVFVVGSNSLKSFRFYLGMYRFGAFLRKEKINIIQVHFPLSVTAGVIGAKLAGVKKIISCRRDMGFWYTKALIFILRFSNRWVDRFIVNSNEIKGLLQRTENIHPSKITVIHNGIDLPSESIVSINEDFRRKHEIEKETCVVGIVSNMNRVVKRVDVLLNAASILVGKDKNIFFVVVGEGKYLQDLKQKVQDEDIVEKILFYGSHPDPVNIISVFDVCVNTSDSEGFSNAVLEYMICGKPVVATGVGGNLEVVKDGDNGFLFSPGDAVTLSQKIDILSSNIELRKRMGHRSKEKAMYFTCDKMLSEFDREYEKLTNNEF